MTRNPFSSIYIAEEVDPSTFVDLFSPLLVHDTLALFEHGNVILMGTQGSGKSMLLNLLKPEAQIAYALTDTAFPLAGVVTPFIGAGVNLTRCGAIDFGQRDLPGHEAGGGALVEAYFADFLNYWIVRDLFESVQRLRLNAVTRGRLGIATAEALLNDCASALARDPCWAGALEAVEGYESLRRALLARVQAYRGFLNFNTDSLPPELIASKTSAAEPIAVAAECLREHGVIAAEVQVFVRIDQYEELGRLEHRANAMSEAEHNHFEGFAAVIHKMLGLRDPRVSYRIGTRRHAWPDDPRMQGTSAVLEELRNYKLLDLDHLLRRGEHSSGLFRPLAEDIFARRLRVAGYQTKLSGRQAMKQILGSPLSAEDVAARYAPSGARDVVSAEAGWPPDIVSRLGTLAERDPLDGILAEAWFRQQDARGRPLDIDWNTPPWRVREYWRKERVGQALLQLAARQRQRMIWCGDKAVRDLAGSNVLAFMSLCQGIFNAWLRTSPVDGARDSGALTLPDLRASHLLYLQDQGIREASDFWYRKIQSDPDGSSRQRFVNELGQMFRARLRDDLQMSYPGHNGFSVEIAELNRNPDVAEVLKAAGAFGVLFDRVHSTRNKGGGKRQKWYLNPIYAPHFQIPVVHTKEPLYVHVNEVRSWMQQVDILGSAGLPTTPREVNQLQMKV